MRYDNAVALLAGLENPSDETHAGLLAALHQRLRAPELRGLKKIMLAWAAWQARRRLGHAVRVARVSGRGAAAHQRAQPPGRALNPSSPYRLSAESPRAG